MAKEKKVVEKVVDGAKAAVSAVKSVADGKVSIDLGDKEIQLGNEFYRGKMRVSPAVADQIRSMLPHVKSNNIRVKDLFSKK